ncbi:MAG: hypothetical protein EPO51_13095 [Phenylobacterium sp.]|uniref:hypothetical protein n=1 Tax=Phenylobacterium sp. TaxID=1871053 RepID=UPI0011F81568|nr:hypothetical protein [Phenylobacterium sp.]TAJ71235.1 MAG: hypothetical protein EPO51_13095 [Phenylobacterium sp.]
MESGGWARRDVAVAGRVLATAAPLGQAGGAVLTVVIEGDGRAHDRFGRPTADPTPADPQGLRIARAWPDAPKAWIARPCQFTRHADARCRAEDWTVDRFSDAVLAAMDAGVDQLKRQAGAGRVVLVGWSGGGVVAAALARRRSDVAGLVTFAAPLDIAGWTAERDLSPLNLAADAQGLAERLPAIPQAHYLGLRDRVVPVEANPAAEDTADEAHDCCWERRAAQAAARLKAR